MNDLSLLWLPNYKQLCVNFAFGKLPTACLTLRSSAMAFSCSFQKITGTDCSFDRLDKSRSLEIVTLRNCSKDISNHYSHWSFSGVGIFREEDWDAGIRHNLPTPQAWTLTWLAKTISTRVSSGRKWALSATFSTARKGYERGEPTTLVLGRVFPGQSSMSLNNRNCRQWRSDPRPARLSQALFQ